MINLILTLAMNATTPATPVAQFQPCVWPRTCVSQPAPVQTAQFQPCVWPRTCKSQQAPVLELQPAVAQFETCVYPKKCGKAA